MSKLLKVLLPVVGLILAFDACNQHDSAKTEYQWAVPDTAEIPRDTYGDLVRYGRELIVHTSSYFGPDGSISKTENGLNCQNCHLDAGTKYWGNNFGAVYSMYPQAKERTGTVIGVKDKINECFMRSLNGRPRDTGSQEMNAIYAYMQWLGKDVPRGVEPEGSIIRAIPYMQVAADTGLGRRIYNLRCASCHGNDGLGMANLFGPGYAYPPLWGPRSYNYTATFYRIGKLAGFIKDNMPHGSTYVRPSLVDADAWHVAAFINSMPRPDADYSQDWLNLPYKAIDVPFGPYADSFSEKRHKYGPWIGIPKAKKLSH